MQNYDSAPNDDFLSTHIVKNALTHIGLIVLLIPEWNDVYLTYNYCARNSKQIVYSIVYLHGVV